MSHPNPNEPTPVTNIPLPYGEDIFVKIETIEDPSPDDYVFTAVSSNSSSSFSSADTCCTCTT